MKKNFKYAPPTLKVHYIEMEQGIVAESAEIRIGTSTNEDTPQVDQWETGGTFNGNFNL